MKKWGHHQWTVTNIKIFSSQYAFLVVFHGFFFLYCTVSSLTFYFLFCFVHSSARSSTLVVFSFFFMISFVRIFLNLTRDSYLLVVNFLNFFIIWKISDFLLWFLRRKRKCSGFLYNISDFVTDFFPLNFLWVIFESFMKRIKNLMDN